MEIKLSRKEVVDILTNHISNKMNIPPRALNLIELVPVREVIFVVKEIKQDAKSTT